jgi:uncharacterized protein with HEPN domain
MKHNIKVWLQDIDNSITEIYDFLPKSNNFLDFQKDLKTRKAVERNIEIIGEALNRILNIKPDIVISDSRKIVDTRNRIIHGYNNVTADVLWLIISKYLPRLEKEVKKLFK